CRTRRDRGPAGPPPQHSGLVAAARPAPAATVDGRGPAGMELARHRSLGEGHGPATRLARERRWASGCDARSSPELGAAAPDPPVTGPAQQAQVEHLVGPPLASAGGPGDEVVDFGVGVLEVVEPEVEGEPALLAPEAVAGDELGEPLVLLGAGHAPGFARCG